MLAGRNTWSAIDLKTWSQEIRLCCCVVAEHPLFYYQRNHGGSWLHVQHHHALIEKMFVVSLVTEPDTEVLEIR